jgi:hypothetical protein
MRTTFSDRLARVETWHILVGFAQHAADVASGKTSRKTVVPEQRKSQKEVDEVVETES